MILRIYFRSHPHVSRSLVGHSISRVRETRDNCCIVSIFIYKMHFFFFQRTLLLNTSGLGESAQCWMITVSLQTTDPSEQLKLYAPSPNSVNTAVVRGHIKQTAGVLFKTLFKVGSAGQKTDTVNTVIQRGCSLALIAF